jgi:hypothetical protein
LITPFQDLVLGFILVVWFMEGVLKNVPELERKDTIGQCGHQVAFALAILAFISRAMFHKEEKTKDENERRKRGYLSRQLRQLM